MNIFKEMLSSKRSALGNYHEDVGMTLNVIGSVYAKFGKVQKAINFVFKALKIRRSRVLGESHLVVAMTYDRLGQLYLEQGRNMKEAVR